MYTIQIVVAESRRMFSLWMLPVFVYCLWIGMRFARRRVEHWAMFFFFPTLFLAVALFSLLLRGSSYLLVYCMSSWIGGLVGLIATNRVPIKIDVTHHTISTPGSWLMLVSLVFLFSAKCIVTFLAEAMPNHTLAFKEIGWGVKGVATGLLFGQAISFWRRFLIAEACDKSELVRGRFVFFVGPEKVSPARYSAIKKSS